MAPTTPASHRPPPAMAHPGHSTPNNLMAVSPPTRGHPASERPDRQKLWGPVAAQPCSGCHHLPQSKPELSRCMRSAGVGLLRRGRHQVPPPPVQKVQGSHSGAFTSPTRPTQCRPQYQERRGALGYQSSGWVTAWEERALSWSERWGSVSPGSYNFPPGT